MTAADAALSYARRGWPVLPIRPHGKTPYTTHGVKDATTDDGLIAAWFEQWPDAGVAIATGSPGPTVLDVDDPAGAREVIAKLAGTAPTVATPRGMHFYFEGDGAGTVALPFGELRGRGAYVVAPPSVHTTGRAYVWTTEVNGSMPALPGFIVGERKADGGPAPRVGDAIAEGKRNSTLASLAGTMRRRGMSADEIAAALKVTNARRCNPSLPESEVEVIARSVGRYEPAAGPAEGDDPRAQLTTLLKLDAAGYRVAGARIVGTGSAASVDLYIADAQGEVTEVGFKARRDVANALRLNVEMSCYGVTSALKAPDAVRANVLLGQIATHEPATSDDDAAIVWGLAYLRAADSIEADLGDQAERWGTFAHLQGIDPVAAARANLTSVAAAGLVVNAPNGARWVRSSWFYAHVRSIEAGAMSNVEVAHRMARVGWLRRGHRGRLKATHPSDPNRGPVFLSFYLVPRDWEEGAA
jgi:hypothetical protein